MPLLRKEVFRRMAPPPKEEMDPEEEVFVCEATKEVFRDYEEFFQRTILCNSLVWSCAITGKSGLTYEEALESERKAKRRLGTLPKPLKRGLLWVAHHAKRGRISDLVDDVYVFTANRYFVGEVVEAIVNEMWCQCTILGVIPPSEEEILKDKEESESSGSSPTNKKKKSFFPPDHLFKYRVQETEPDDPEVNEIHEVEAEDVRREKGVYTREKNLLFLKNVVELGRDGNFRIKDSVSARHNVPNIKYADIFAGQEPVFEETKRVKGMASSNSALSSSSSALKKQVKGKTAAKHQGTLDGWMKGSSSSSPSSLGNNSEEKPKIKKQTPAEIEAEMKRIRERNARFKEEMRQRAEEAKKRRMEERAKEKERKKEEKKLLQELMSEWNKKREDLICEDHKNLPRPQPVHCKVPNRLFGDFLMLLEFYNGFSEVLETKDSFPSGVSFDILESALTERDAVSGSFYDILSFMMKALFDLQREEEEEVKMDKTANQNADLIDKNILGKDEDIAKQIRSATQMLQWSRKHQGQDLGDLHLDQWSITEILRLHLESAGAFRGDKLSLWRYQQRGGYRLSDDPGLHFRMEEPQILEALTVKTVFELSVQEKLKILTCLMEQILSFATVRDEIDERFNALYEAKAELRNHQINENRRQRQVDEAKKAKLKEEKLHLQQQQQQQPQPQQNGEKKTADEVHLTTRQKEALQSQREKEEKDRQKKEELLRLEASEKEKSLVAAINDLQSKVTVSCLGRDRAYRRFWALDTVPGIFVEHDDDFVGPCLPEPTPYNPNAGPIDEATAIEKVKEIMLKREKANEEKASSDKENDQEDSKTKDTPKTYSKKSIKPVVQQKVLSAKNGTLITSDSTTQVATTSTEDGTGVTLVESATAGATAPSESTTTTATIESGVVTFTVKKEERADMVCLGDMENCPVHSTILPKTHWSFFSKVDELEELIKTLNPRGIRESELRDRLIAEKEKIVKNLRKFNIGHKLIQEDIKEEKEVEKEDLSISKMVDLTLRDQILELEEKIFFGTLGTLKIRSRESWQKAIQDGFYDKQCPNLSWGGKSIQDTPIDSREESRPSTPNVNLLLPQTAKEGNKVRGLASAILQVGQMVDEKYIKSPLGEDEKGKKKRLKEEEKRKKEEEDGISGEDSKVKEILTPFQEWEISLMNSTSYAQLFIHLTTLENSIIWSKSVMNTKCRICRRKTDPEKMLLCDGCDRGHHMYCLKPKLKVVPEGDWFCQDCKPKERIRSPKKSRRVFSTTDDEAEEEEEEKTGEAEALDEFPNDEDSLDSDDSDLEVRKKSKKGNKKIEQPKKRRTITQLLGKRRCATEANERISRVCQETSSGNSSGSELSLERHHSTRLTRRTAVTNSSSTSNLHQSSSSSSSSSSKKRKRDEDDDDLFFTPTILEDILNGMMKHRDGWPFDRPITKADAPDYHKIIKRPMDLGTIRSGINRMKYTTNVDVIDDIKLVFENCRTYNREDAVEFQCGTRLEKYFYKEMNKLGLGHLINNSHEKSSKKLRKTL